MDASSIKLHVKLLTPTVTLPVRSTENASCFDVCADLDGVISPGDRLLVKTGLAVAVPQGFEVQVRSRSGLALKKGVAVLNSPGTVDADYRGEVGVILINHGHEPFTLKRGDRIAQLGVYRVEMCPAVAVEVLEETERGAGGFGTPGFSSLSGFEPFRLLNAKPPLSSSREYDPMSQSDANSCKDRRDSARFPGLDWAVLPVRGCRTDIRQPPSWARPDSFQLLFEVGKVR